MNIVEQVIERLKSPTPKFWKKVLYLGVTLTAISGGLLVAPEGIHIPQWLESLAGYLATAGFVLTVVAKATTTNENLSNQ